MPTRKSCVALLAEGVDRNQLFQQPGLWCRVALLAEGVDRNMEDLAAVKGKSKSPSSRRAWIEISLLVMLCGRVVVALLAEGVDRNLQVVSMAL